MNKQSGTQSIQRSLSLLRAVGEHAAGVRLSHLARQRHLPPATVHRILAALAAEGFVEFDPESKRYRLGIELYLLGKKARRFTIRDRYRPALERIAQAVEDSVYLVVRSGYDALCIDLKEGKYAVRVLAYRIGSRKPLGVGAASLALLAFSSNADVEKTLSANRVKYRAHQKTTLDSMRRAIADSRRRGYVFSQGRYLKGVNGVGLPLYNHSGHVIAAISVGAMAERLDPQRADKVVAIMRRAIDPIKLFPHYGNNFIG